MGFVNSKKYDGVQLYHKKNKDISYYIRFKDQNNSLQRVKIGDKSKGITEAYCFKKRNEMINKINLGEDFQAKSKKFIFQDAFDAYIIWAKANKKTWKYNDYTTYIKHLEPFIGKKQLKLLKPHDFEKIKQIKIDEGYSPKTVLGILATARQIINYAINNELIKGYTNPIAGGRVKMPKLDNKKLGYLSEEQAQLLLDTLYNRTHHLVYNLTLILLYTGARFSEVTSLRWYDVNFDTRLIFFNTSKEGEERYIYIVDKLFDLLKSLYQEAKSKNDYVIPSSTGERITQMPRQWQLIVDELIPNNKDAGKYRITVHSLRHTHASWLAISGIQLLALKEQLGHKTLEMTLRYSHLMPSHRHDQTNKVFEAF